MASAVLASNNELPLHRYYAVSNNRNAVSNNSNAVSLFQLNQNPNPNFTPNFNSIVKNPNSTPDFRSNRNSTVKNADSGPGFRSGRCLSSAIDYVTFDLRGCSRGEIRGLRKRLRAELDQVREARARIEERECAPKKASGRKRTGFAGFAGFERGSKRGNVVAGPEIDGLVRKIMVRCSQMLGKLMKHKHAWIFNTPVDTVGLGLHDYFTIIERPMDLGTVKAKLSRKEYRGPSDFASDVRLTFKNAMVYNPKGQDAHIMADNLMGVFDKMFNPSFAKFEAEKGRLLAAFGGHKRVPDTKIPERKTVEVVDLSKSLPLRKSSPKLMNPKEKDLSKREMSYEEKTKLGVSLQELPSENMGEMLAILGKRNKGMAQDGDEIELDFETLDNETLWELKTFVSNLEKVDDVAVPAQAEKCDVVEEDVDIGEDIPITNYPPVEIEKDSSSGSSSGSSSSSGSGSVTSSGSDSDEDSVQSPFVEPK